MSILDLSSYGNGKFNHFRSAVKSVHMKEFYAKIFHDLNIWVSFFMEEKVCPTIGKKDVQLILVCECCFIPRKKKIKLPILTDHDILEAAKYHQHFQICQFRTTENLNTLRNVAKDRNELKKFTTLICSNVQGEK